LSIRGELMASGAGDETARLWDASTGEAESVLEGHAGGLGLLACSPDGTLLASSREDSTVRISGKVADMTVCKHRADHWRFQEATPMPRRLAVRVRDGGPNPWNR